MTSRFKKVIFTVLLIVLAGTGLVLAFNNPTQPPPGGEISFWRINGGDIHYDAGSVGVGTSAPSYKLHASGEDIYASGYIRAGTQLCIGSDCRTAWSDVPSGGIAFFATSTCPTGWSEVTAARGRYLVGLPSGGTLAGTAGQLLTNLENRPVGQHTHDVNEPKHSHATDGVLVGPFPQTYQYGGGGKHFTYGNTGESTAGVTVNATGTVAGTNVPYVQFLVCQKS